MTVLANIVDMPALRIKFNGEEVDQYGTNIHQLGRALISSQELVNITASHQIKRDFPIEKYSLESTNSLSRRALFFQGHLGTVKKGSLDLVIQLVNQPELRSYIANPDVRAFGISILANLVSTAAGILTGKIGEKKPDQLLEQQYDGSLAIQLAPHLERLTRTVTPKGGIGSIEMIAEEPGGGRVELRVDRQSRDRVLEYADNAPTEVIDLVGEVRSIDLDSRRITILHSATRERIEVEFLEFVSGLNSYLQKVVYIRGRVRTRINRWGSVENKIEAESIQLVQDLA